MTYEEFGKLLPKLPCNDYMWHWANKEGSWAHTYKFSNEGNRIVEVRKHEKD